MTIVRIGVCMCVHACMSVAEFAPNYEIRKLERVRYCLMQNRMSTVERIRWGFSFTTEIRNLYEKYSS